MELKLEIGAAVIRSVRREDVQLGLDDELKCGDVTHRLVGSQTGAGRFRRAAFEKAFRP
jgi:hypothetical protein